MINEILWPDNRIEHLAKHEVSPDEFEEVCFGKPLVLKTRTEGKNPVYLVLGRTDSGRYLTCVVIYFPDRKGYPVTARDMTKNERQRFNRWNSK